MEQLKQTEGSTLYIEGTYVLFILAKIIQQW